MTGRSSWFGQPVVVRRWHLFAGGFILGSIAALGIVVGVWALQNRQDRVRSDRDIARIAAKVICKKDPAVCRAERRALIVRAIVDCGDDVVCRVTARRVFGPSSSRLQAHARRAVRLECADRACRGDTGPTGPAGPKGDPGRPGHDGRDGHDGRGGRDGAPGAPGPRGAPGSPGAAAHDVIAELCRRAGLVRLLCPHR